MTDVSHISVAVLYPGGRVNKMLRPLEASRLNVAVEPHNPYTYDFVLADNADTDLGKEVLKKPFHSAELIYRLRGNVFKHFHEEWSRWNPKRPIAEQVVLPHVDGVISISDRLGDVYADLTGFDRDRIRTALLPIDPKEWPTTQHTDNELRAITLTNMDYLEKVAPITEWAGHVENALRETGGKWHVCGNGRHSDWVADRLEHFDYVQFRGYQDNVEELRWANVLLHPSRFDALPNAVLEGLASGLPVVANPFIEFKQYAGPILVTERKDVAEKLEMLADPTRRDSWGAAGRTYVAGHHLPRTIAKQYERYFLGMYNRR